MTGVQTCALPICWGLFATPPGYEVSTVDLDPADPDSVSDFYYCDSPNVYPLPDLTTEYGDVFEEIVYSYEGERLRVCKSIVGPFSATERLDAMDEIEKRFLHTASEEGDDPRTWRVHFRGLTSLLLPEYGNSLIEADILEGAGSRKYKDKFRMLKEELRACGDGYLKRSQASLRR